MPLASNRLYSSTLFPRPIARRPIWYLSTSSGTNIHPMPFKHSHIPLNLPLELGRKHLVYCTRITTTLTIPIAVFATSPIVPRNDILLKRSEFVE